MASAQPDIVFLGGRTNFSHGEHGSVCGRLPDLAAYVFKLQLHQDGGLRCLEARAISEGGSYFGAQDEVRAIAVSSTSVLVAGNGGVPRPECRSAAMEKSAFVAKYTADGLVHRWSTCCRGVRLNDAAGLGGDLIVVGGHHGAATLGGVALPGDSGGLFVAKISGVTGNATRHMSVTRTGAGRGSLFAVSVGPGNRIAAVGECSGKVEFGSGARVTAGAHDACVLMLDSMLTPQWALSFGNAKTVEHKHNVGHAQARDVAFTASGHLIVLGDYGGRVDFGDGRQTPTQGITDAFIVELDPAGGYVRHRVFGRMGTGTDPHRGIVRAGDVAVSGAHIFVTGVFGDGGPWNPPELTHLLQNTTAGLFVMSLNRESFDLEWVDSFDAAPGTDSPQSIAATDRHLLVGASTYRHTDFGVMDSSKRKGAVLLSYDAM
ncbi:MAG: hypothetical protein MJD61_02665 [Proteobacteria bacterium]|nr:hypothetical protein [Pseudomonadota bacterium]